MARLIVIGALVFNAFLLVAGNSLSDYQYDEYEYEDYKDYDDEKLPSKEEKELHVTPEFVTESKKIIVDKGTTIRLECMFDHLPGDINVIWKRPDTKKNSILAIGASIHDQDYTSRANVEINEKGSVLSIGAAEMDDAGEYQCGLGVPGQGSLKHFVSIRVPPEISSHSDTFIETEKGKQVMMECKGTGTPTPTLEWTKIGKGKMPGGEKKIKGENFIIKKVDRHHAGVYRCTADNGFSKAASKDIELRVLYKPEIEVQEVFIHTRAGNEAELVCNVHGMPKPEVEWKKDGQSITESNKLKFQKEHSKHSLIILSVEKADFGKYTCYARSERGVTSQTLEISGTVGEAEFKSMPAGTEPTSYVLEWTSVSYSPVTAFRVETRPAGTTAWKEMSVSPVEDSTFHYVGKLLLKQLQQATRYEARVSGRNDEGWNQPSQLFYFATQGAEPKQEGMVSGNSGADSRQNGQVSLIFATCVMCVLTAILK